MRRSSRAPTRASGRCRRLAALLVPLLLAGGLAGCGDERGTVVVGSKFFTEQDILGELVATWIERTTDLTARRRLHLGGTFICHEALTTGELDLYVEYTGTALTAILEQPPVQDPDSVLRTVREAYRERWNLAWTEPLGFENTFAMLVRRPTADSLGLATVSDLAEHAEDLRLGVNYEFVEREDGLPGLRKAYDMSFRGQPRTMELGLMYRALSEEKVDVIAGNSTDGQIEALDLVALEDDRRYFPPYHAAPVVNAALLERHPELRRSLERLGGLIDTREMRRLNRQVDVEERDFRNVARQWVERTLAGEVAPAADAEAATVPTARAGSPRSSPGDPPATAAASAPSPAPPPPGPR